LKRAEVSIREGRVMYISSNGDRSFPLEIRFPGETHAVNISKKTNEFFLLQKAGHQNLNLILTAIYCLKVL